MPKRLSCVKSEFRVHPFSLSCDCRRGDRIKQHEERQTKNKKEGVVPEGAVPPYLLDREGQSRATVLSNMIKQKRKEKAVSIYGGTLSLYRIHLLTGHCLPAQVPYP